MINDRLWIGAAPIATMDPSSRLGVPVNERTIPRIVWIGMLLPVDADSVEYLLVGVTPERGCGEGVIGGIVYGAVSANIKAVSSAMDANALTSGVDDVVIRHNEPLKSA